ncbi:hypothetical protein D3C76_1219050 [compost metagenome]
MARNGTSSGLAGPVVPEVNISRNGASAPSNTGSQRSLAAASAVWKSTSLDPSRAPTQMIVGHPCTSSSLLRLSGSVTTALAPDCSSRCSMALGPKAVNKG